jgi:hypothetical protein
VQVASRTVSPDSSNPKAAVGATPAVESAQLKELTTAIAVTISAVVPLPTSPEAVTAGTGTAAVTLAPAPSAALTLPVKDQPMLPQSPEPYPNTVPLQFGSVAAVLHILPPLEAVPPSSSSSSSFSAVDATHSLFNKKRIAVSNFTGTAATSSHLSNVPEGDRWLGLQAHGPDPTTLSASVVLEQSERLLKKLLKVLHVCARYQMCTGKTLPPTIDYFGQTLLGMTSIR